MLLAVASLWAQQPVDPSHLSLSTIASSVEVLKNAKDTVRIGRVLDTLFAYEDSRHSAVAGDTNVIFLYRGPARRVAVAGDFNGWSPSTDLLRAVGSPPRWFLVTTVPHGARFEYKFVVDSTMVLDPLNALQAMGGFGPNSEIRTSGYASPQEIIRHDEIPQGTFDTVQMRSRALGCTHPVYIYLPHGARRTGRTYCTLVVTDGGDFLSLGRMNVILDNLIEQKRIPPVIALFVDPRSDPADPSTNARMVEYAMNDRYVTFVADELLPSLRRRYSLASSPDSVAISGASMGGLIATYAAFRRPDVFGASAAQSPSYWWSNDSMITVMRESSRKPARFYLDSGILHDAAKETRMMRSVLQEKGYAFSYAEYPEGHNWVNWRARVASFLTYFWGLH